MFCIDADTGLPVEGFANNGKLDLHKDLDRDTSQMYIAMTTPGIIFQDLIIIGSRVNEGAVAAPGYIRAYDVYTGALRWKFHTIPKPGEEGYESWEDKEAWKNIGGANAWAGFSLDEKRGIVYAPIGSASYDFYGGKRKGDNLFANSILALDAATGKKIWHFQTVHHDVWDRDLPTAPALVTVEQNGKKLMQWHNLQKEVCCFYLTEQTENRFFQLKKSQCPTSQNSKEKSYRLRNPGSSISNLLLVNILRKKT